MTDILLIQPPIRDYYLTHKRTVPYGLAAVGAALIENGFTVELLDALAVGKARIIPRPNEMAYMDEFYGTADVSPFALFHHFRHYGYSYEHIKNQIKRIQPLIAGISSLFTAYSEEALTTAKIVKEACPNCHVVLGGHHPTMMPDHVMACTSVDFVLRGEGEVSLPMLARVLKEGAAPGSVPGIVYRKANGSLAVSEPAFMKKLDNYPLPANRLIRRDYYQRNKKGAAVVITGRGCPMRCSYCAVSRDTGTPYRKRSVESVFCEIQQAISAADARFIDFEDENLSLDKRWFLQLLNRIQNRFGTLGIELRAMNGLYPPSLDEELIEAMKSAGFKTLNLSLGSTSETQLKRFNRPDVRTDFENAVKWAENYDMDSVGYVIAGAPHQTPSDSLADLLYLYRQKVLAGMSIYYPAPGSRDFEACKNLNVLPRHPALMRSSAIPITHTTTRTESVTLLRLSRIANFIKFLGDHNEAVPEPMPASRSLTDLPVDRIGIGKKLLQAFLFDGRIRGVTPEGRWFEHSVSTDLTRRFIRKAAPLLHHGA